MIAAPGGALLPTEAAGLYRILSRRAVEEAVCRAGFVEVSQPDVGAEDIVAFLVATKPVQARVPT